MGVFLFSSTIAGTIAATVVGAIEGHYEDSDGNVPPEITGNIMAINTTVPSLLAAVCFYFSGIHYANYKQAVNAEKE